VKKSPLKWSSILQEKYTEQFDGGVKMEEDGLVYTREELNKFKQNSPAGRKMIHFAKREFKGLIV
jgi:hypothetical protein